MKHKDEIKENSQNEDTKKVKDTNYYHNILNKELIIALIIFGCYFCFYVYNLGEKVTNNYIESLFKAFFLIIINIVVLLYKHITSKSFGILCIIDSIIILVLTFALSRVEVFYPFIAIPILIHSALYIHTFKKEAPEEIISDNKVFVSLVPIIILLVVFILIVILKKKVIYNTLIGLLFIGSFNVAGNIICTKYIKNNKVLLTIISIVFSILYIAYGLLVYFD